MCLADFGNRILRNYEQSESRLWTECAAGLLPSSLDLLLSQAGDGSAWYHPALDPAVDLLAGR